MKPLCIFVIAVGAALALTSLMLSVSAFSDAWYYSCPGNQCSDAVLSGKAGAFAAMVGLVIAGGGLHLLRRSRG